MHYSRGRHVGLGVDSLSVIMLGHVLFLQIGRSHVHVWELYYPLIFVYPTSAVFRDY